jgi:hypothetical protein
MREWDRLNSSAYQRINYHLHMNFLQEHIGKDKKVLDDGCRAGRSSIAIAKAGLKNIVLGSSPCLTAGFRSKAVLLEKY